MKLMGKIFIDGIIEVKTGLHIGGSSTALDIGGIDSNVIKNANGVPYIPGSSLKGKMRSLMELKYSQYTQRTGKVDSGMEEADDGNPDIQRLFGSVAEKAESKTRLIVRDAFISEETRQQMQDKENPDSRFANLELDYTEGKWENTIDRLTSTANPRQLERVPAGAEFNFSLVFNIFGNDQHLLKMVFEALLLVQDDYLGGSGSRGYGQVEFKKIQVGYKNAENYQKQEPAQPIRQFPTLAELSLENLPVKWGENDAQN